MNNKYFKINKAQFTFVEIIFLILLFTIISGYVFFDFDLPSKDYSLTLQSGLNSIYYSEDFREIIINENLSEISLTENWNSFNQTLNAMFNNFEFIIIDENNEKKIFSCEELSGKLFDEKIISVNSADNFKFRKIRLGVCY